ncbi:MAG TPA: prepilin peptidase [Pirellulales bacterium]|jgi:prepilin peptidase CpaA|nr:prepilin peptidase [Pirellulales bacterium]
MDVANLDRALVENWHVWLVTLTLIVAAVIDGLKLKVPNWITFPMILSGWVYSTVAFGWEGLGASLLGTAVGLGLLLPAYAIGGMGAGDVKLLAGVGAWMGTITTIYAFCVSALVGGVIAVAMVLYRRAWEKHRDQFWTILNEVTTIRDPELLSAIAAERKKSMLLLPYGIPIALGSIAYFFWAGMLI